MRLLDTNTIQLHEFPADQIPLYAILSHRWGAKEITLQELENGSGKTKDGFKKVLRCCQKAKIDGFRYAWIDSCCIDKTSSAELSESINSMYQWYFESERCYAYLADVPTIKAGAHISSINKAVKESEWFRRGFTLQELIAPADLRFLDTDWNEVGTKESLQGHVSECTGIPRGILNGTLDIESASVAQRMSWAANRKTSRLEDRAYSLMGIFSVNMPLLYGEGERAFIRLQEEILKTSGDRSLFAWQSPDTRGGLLATSPDAFEHARNIIPVYSLNSPRTPLTVSNLGVHMNVRFLGAGQNGLGLVVLDCKEEHSGDNQIGIFVRDLDWTMQRFGRVMSTKLERIDTTQFRLSLYSSLQSICIETHRINLIRRSRGLATDASQQHYAADNVFQLAGRTGRGDSMALLLAAEQGRVDDVWLLFTQNNVRVNMADDRGQTPLWMAIYHGHEIIVQMLLLRNDIQVHVVDKQGQGLVAAAASKGRVGMAQLVLEKGADVDAQDQLGRTPLCSALKHGSMAMVSLLLENGADPNIADVDGRTPLCSALQHGSMAMVSLLLENGADPNIADLDCRAALSWAVKLAREDLAELLLDNGASVNAPDSLGQTPLFIAAVSDQGALVQLLMSNGADASLRDGQGRLPLWEATLRGHVEVVRVLLKTAADVDARYVSGRTLLWVAVNAKNVSSRTLLWVAADNRYAAIVRLLLDNGASPDAKDNAGVSPLFRATRRKPDDAIRIMMEDAVGVDRQKRSRFNLPWSH